LAYLMPDAFRSELRAAGGKRVHVANREERLTLIDGTISPLPENRYDRFKDPLLLPTRALLQERLASLGVDVRVSSFGRLEGRPVYVIGARYPDLSPPQLWLEKESFRPLRWIFPASPAEGPAGSFEIRYLDWQRQGTRWYPMRVEFHQGESRVRVVLAESVEVNPSLPAALFDMARIRSTARSAAPPPTEEPASRDLNEVRRAIEDFRRMME